MDGAVSEGTQVQEPAAAPGLKKANGANWDVISQIADTIGMDVTVGKNGDLFATGKFKLSAPALGLKGMMSPKIVSSFLSANGEDAGVIVHLSGDLHVFVFASDFDQVVILDVLDGSKGAKVQEDRAQSPLSGFFERMSIRSKGNAAKFLAGKIVAKYSRAFTETAWQRVS